MKIKQADGTIIEVEDDHELDEGEELVTEEEEAEETDDDPEESEEESDEEEAEDEMSEEPESDEESDEEDESEDDDDEVIVTIGDEAPPPEEDDSKAPEWVRELRKNHRETVRRNKELEAEVEQLKTPKQEQKPLGPKPKLEDFDYDTAKFETALTSWHDKKRKADEVAREHEAAEEEQKKAWQGELNTYGEQKTALKVKDFDDAEAAVLDTFNQTQQGIIIQGSENKALVIYALGKNDVKAKELSQITDPVKFAFAVAKLEDQLKVKNRKKAPPAPEKKVTGTGPKSGTVDSTLERLRTEAAKTGDYSKVHQYKQQRKQAKT